MPNTEPKWTKGPMKLKSGIEDDEIHIVNYRGQALAQICYGDLFHGVIEVGEARANAHLIAAAQELADNHIAVCTEPIGWKEDPDYSDGGYYCLTKSKYDAMCAALSKALGEKT